MSGLCFNDTHVCQLPAVLKVLLVGVFFPVKKFLKFGLFPGNRKLQVNDLICEFLVLRRQVFEPFLLLLEISEPQTIAPDDPRDIATLTQYFSRTIEEYIRRYPEQWVWFHRRWKRAERERLVDSR